MDKANEDRGLIFFNFLPIGLGIAYGIFGKSFFFGEMWWLETLVAAAVFASAHVLVRSWLFVEHARNGLSRGTIPTVPMLLVLALIFNSALIFIPALLALLVRKIIT